MADEEKPGNGETERLIIELPDESPDEAEDLAEAVTTAVTKAVEEAAPIEASATEVSIHLAVAFRHYILDSDKRPAEAFYPYVAKHMTLTAYHMRVRDRRWREEREQLWARIQRQLIERLEGQVVKRRIKEMEQLERLRDVYMELITPDEVEVVDEDGTKHTVNQFKAPVKDLGQAVKCAKDVALLLEMSRAKVLGELDVAVPAVEATTVEESAGAGTLFTQDELATLAHGLLKSRAGLGDGNN